MKDFVRPQGRLAKLPLSARVVYTIFLMFTLAALAISVWLTEAMVQLDLKGVDSYYAGLEDHNVDTARADSAGGPKLALPEDMGTDIPDAEPMSIRKLLEVTHFHLFSMPVYLMILAHLFMLSRRSESMKLTWIGIGSVSVLAHIIAPWVARSGAPPGHLLFALSGLGLGISFGVMCAVPLWEMWARISAEP